MHGELADGVIDIIDTPNGERMRFVASQVTAGLTATVRIDRGNGAVEVLELIASGDPRAFLSGVAPAEPHEFDAVLRLGVAGQFEDLAFQVQEPTDHGTH